LLYARALASAGSLAGGQVVIKASTTIGLTSVPNPSVSGQRVTFTATVTSTYAGSITGQVQFGVDPDDMADSLPISMPFEARGCVVVSIGCLFG